MSQESKNQLEIELKFPCGDFTAIEERLREKQARLLDSRQETDRYFNAPDRDFARTGEALRLRRIGLAACITYKGPKRNLPVKIRAEIEVPLAQGEKPAHDCACLLVHLGFREILTIKKTRRLYSLQRAGCRVEVCLDEVEGLGRFVELEVLAPEAEAEAARGAVSRLADELGLSGPESRSYLELLLGKGDRGIS